MTTSNTLRRLVLESFLFLSIFFVIVGSVVFYGANQPAQGFITTAHDDPGRFASDTQILIKRVHDDSWDIFYNFAPDCPDSRKTAENLAAVREVTEKAIRLWLQPLHEITNKPIVDTFVFHQMPLSPSTGELGLHFYHEEDVQRIKPAIKIIFSCRTAWSFASRAEREVFIFEHPRALELVPISPELLYTIDTIVHELGHAFDLADTYVGSVSGAPSTGNVAKTVGSHPYSVMASGIFKHPDSDMPGNHALSEDDRQAIQSLYRYHFEMHDATDCPPDFVFEEISGIGRWQEYRVRGCVPRQPLIFEARQGHLILAWSLLIEDSDLNVNELDADGHTALHHLTVYGEDESLTGVLQQLLVYSNINLNIKNRHGNTALHLAAIFNNQEMIRQLLQMSNVDFNAQNALGNTALHLAAQHGRTEIVKSLLTHKDINLNIRNAAGLTPLQVAQQRGAHIAAAADEHTADIKAWLAQKQENWVPTLNVESLILSPPAQQQQQGREEIVALLRATPGIILPEASDVNGDGVVNILDLVSVSSQLGKEVPETTDAATDVNRDGVVNIQDLVWVAGAFGQTDKDD